MQPDYHSARLRVASGWDWRNCVAACEPLRSLRSSMVSVDFRVELAEQIDVAGSLELFRRSGDDLIDRWDGHRLIRAVPVGTDRWVPFIAQLVAGTPPGFGVTVARPVDADVVRCAVAS